MTFEEVLGRDDIRADEYIRIGYRAIDMGLCSEVDDVGRLVFLIHSLESALIRYIHLLENIIRRLSDMSTYASEISCIGEGIEIDELDIWIPQDIGIKEMGSDKSSSSGDKYGLHKKSI